MQKWAFKNYSMLRIIAQHQWFLTRGPGPNGVALRKLPKCDLKYLITIVFFLLKNIPNQNLDSSVITK